MAATTSPSEERGTSLPPRLGDTLAASLERVARRCDGREKPIALPWAVLADHYGGGLWPGLHLLNKGTGVGGSQFALQVGLGAAKAGTPTLYIGLELGELDLDLRLLGEEARVPWAHLYTGKAGRAYVERARAAVAKLRGLPFHSVVAPPMGFPASAIRLAVEGMREGYAEPDGAGSRPMLVIVDFLQLVGDEQDEVAELRARIGEASYVLRDLANRLGVAVLAILSVARERYKLLSEIRTTAALAWEEDENERPIKRRILNTDAIVGMGKESGELEYSADSVSVLACVTETRESTGATDVVFATAKGRATGAMWSPLHFTGFRYEECPDGGGRMLQAWKEGDTKRQEAREAKATAKTEAKAVKVQADVAAVRAFVLANDRCTVRMARAKVNNNPARWDAVVAAMGKSLVKTEINATLCQLSVVDDA